MDQRLSQRLKREMEFEFARTAPPEGFPAFPDIPAGRYVDPAFFALERERLWSRSWLLACHADELPHPGSFLLWEARGAPILLVRGRDRRVRAFYNTCRHRGGPVVRETAGTAKTLRCAYHSWTYDLEGSLIGVPDERDFVGLDKSCRSLIPVRCETWGNWLFVNEDPGAPTLLESLGSVPEEIADFQPESLRFVERHTFTLACNWKVAIDSFLEVYHLKHIHPNTVDRFLDHRGAVMGLIAGGHSRMVTPIRPANLGRSLPGFPEIETVGDIPRLTNLAYGVFPNLVTPLDVTGFPILLFWPTDIRTTRFDVLWCAPGFDPSDADQVAAWQRRIALFDVVLREDTENCAWIQKSVESRGFKGIPLNYQERRIYHFHEQIDRVLGDEVPAALRVAPRLAAYVERPPQPRG